MITADEVLRNRLVRVMEHPEVRSGQLAMAESIATALEKQACVAVEAGTGTGKSLAALVPAALYAARHEKRVVVAPHTIALQEQLIRKDVPLLQKLLAPDVKLKARVIKGRGNYVCNWKVHESHRFVRGLSFVSPAAAAQFTKLIEHLKRTDVGERENVPFGLLGEVWEPVKSEGDSCTGQRCRYFRECHYLKTVREAAKADLIIANQALVFTDLALRAGGQDGVLPEYDVLILDEAHHLEESATRAWKVQLDGRTFERAARALRELAGTLGAKKRGADRFQACAEAVIQEGVSWLRSLPVGAVHAPCGDPAGLSDLVSSAERDLAWLEGAALKDEQQMAMETCAARLGDLLGNVRAWSEQSLGEWAYWVTQDRRGNATAEMAPIEVAPELQSALFRKDGPVVVCMSATLSSAGLARVGFPAPEVIRVASPFDYHRQALLYVPIEALEPKHPRYQEYVVKECLQLIEVSQGRALVLFTSWKLLEQTYEHMAPILDSWGFKPLKQGDLPREKLVQAFRADESSCLMGLASLWEGVDVPGSSCSLVILTRLPFSVPTEPLAVARAERVRAQGGDPFAVLSLPDAVLRFKQGFGRLIRTAADRGVVACLDGRFLSSRYGHEFRQAVREVPGTRSLRKVHLLLSADRQRAEAG